VTVKKYSEPLRCSLEFHPLDNLAIAHKDEEDSGDIAREGASIGIDQVFQELHVERHVDHEERRDKAAAVVLPGSLKVGMRAEEGIERDENDNDFKNDEKGFEIGRRSNNSTWRALSRRRARRCSRGDRAISSVWHHANAIKTVYKYKYKYIYTCKYSENHSQHC